MHRSGTLYKPTPGLQHGTTPDCRVVVSPHHHPGLLRCRRSPHRRSTATLIGTTVHIVPHTHWDREWYAPFQTFRAQLVELWDELLSLAETDSSFYFLMDGQTVVIEDYLAIKPEARERVQRAIARGLIQVGPWYTLPDEFLVSGETLVRNLERGLALGDAYGGALRVGYLPDSFGHAAQMPQIYQQFGLSHAVVWRGVPRAIDRLAFAWEAPDGTTVLTAYMGTSYSHGFNLPSTGPELAARIRAALQDLEPFRPGSDLLLMNGTDHAAPQRGLSTVVREAGRLLDGVAVRLARLDDYLGRLPATGWPPWKGELRASSRANILMGTLSVRVPDKQAYFMATQNLERRAEPLAALTGLPAGGLMTQAWTLILHNAAHDTACGSGIDAVAEEARLRSRSAGQIADVVVERAMRRLAVGTQPKSENLRDGIEAVIWNPSPYPRSGLVQLRVPPAGGSWVAENSQEALAAQSLDEPAAPGPVDKRLLVPTGTVPGCSWTRVRVRPGVAKVPAGRVRTTSDSMANDHLACRLAPNGTFSVEHFDTNVRYEGLNRLVDGGDAGDEYNYSPPAQDILVSEPVRVSEPRWLESGPHRSTLEVSTVWQVPLTLAPDRQRRGDELVQLPVVLRISLEAGTPQVDCELELENTARDHRLRAHFPLPFAASHSYADSAYYVARRAAVPLRYEPGAPEWELPTYPMRTFVDAADGTVGMALITEGLHEYELLSPDSPALALTLIRAVGWLSRDDLGYRYGHAGPGLETPGAQVPGRHRFRYSLRFHRNGWERAGLWRAAEATRLPLEVIGVTPSAGSLAQAPMRIELEPDTVQMTACIPTAEGFVLRILNASDSHQEAVVRLSPPPASVRWISLGGSAREHLAPTGGSLRLRLRAWEIATLRVVRS